MFCTRERSISTIDVYFELLVSIFCDPCKKKMIQISHKYLILITYNDTIECPNDFNFKFTPSLRLCSWLRTTSASLTPHNFSNAVYAGDFFFCWKLAAKSGPTLAMSVQSFSFLDWKSMLPEIIWLIIVLKGARSGR